MQSKTSAIRSIPRFIETNVALWASVPELPVEAPVTIPATQLLDSQLPKVCVAPRTSVEKEPEDGEYPAKDNSHHQPEQQKLLFGHVRVPPLECDYYRNSRRDSPVLRALEYQFVVLSYCHRPIIPLRVAAIFGHMDPFLSDNI